MNTFLGMASKPLDQKILYLKKLAHQKSTGKPFRSRSCTAGDPHAHIQLKSFDVGRLSRCPLLLDCPASVPRGDSRDKGRRMLPLIGGMLPVIGGLSVTPCSQARRDQPTRFSRRFAVSSGNSQRKAVSQVSKGQWSCRVQRSTAHFSAILGIPFLTGQFVTVSSLIS